MRIFKWSAVVALYLFVVVVAASAQTISPLSTSYKVKAGKNASGQFTVTNNALMPSNVVVETAAFRWVNGQQVLEPVGANVHVKLSETSFRVGARQSHTFNYSVSCDRLPCAVAMFAGFMSGHVENGVNIAKHCREKMRAILGAKD